MLRCCREKFDCVFSLERTLKQDVYRAGDGLHRVWLERRKQFAPWWKRPLVGLGAFHRNMMALEARTFDPVNTKHVIVNSEMVRGEIAQHFPAFPQERIHLIRNGVEVQRFQKADRNAARQRFGLLADDDFVLVFVGSGWERKGLPWLLKFMAGRGDNPKLKLLVVTRDQDVWQGVAECHSHRADVRGRNRLRRSRSADIPANLRTMLQCGERSAGDRHSRHHDRLQRCG